MKVEYALYKKGSRSIFNSGFFNENGRLIARWSGVDLINELRANCELKDEKGWMIVPLDYACELIDKLDDEMCGNYQRIDEETWSDALEVLPPEKWKSVAGAEIFRMCEYYTSNITNHYIRIGKDYCMVAHRTTKPYEEIALEAHNFFINNQPQETNEG